MNKQDAQTLGFIFKKVLGHSVDIEQLKTLVGVLQIYGNVGIIEDNQLPIVRIDALDYSIYIKLAFIEYRLKNRKKVIEEINEKLRFVLNKYCI